MRVVWTGIDMQVAEKLVAQSVFGEHASDGVFNNLDGVLGEHFSRSRETLSAGISGVAHVNLVGHFLAGKSDFVRIDDDDIVTTIEMRGVIRFCLASEDACDGGSQSADNHLLGVNNNPFFLHDLFVCRNCSVTYLIHFFTFCEALSSPTSPRFYLISFSNLKDNNRYFFEGAKIQLFYI